MLIFLDTEFTDFFDPYLISIGMVADSGAEFYSEVPYLEHGCSAFVREAVIPLLNRYPDAYCELEALGARITAWLEAVKPSDEDVEICIDYQTDWDLFADALDNRIPPWCKMRHVGRDIDETLRYAYHKKSGLPEHHALYDARAACYAFRERSSDATT